LHHQVARIVHFDSGIVIKDNVVLLDSVPLRGDVNPGRRR
jgi:hypothetical protein